MDIASFKAKLDGARAFECAAGGFTFRLRMPTPHAWRLAIERHVREGGMLEHARAMRSVLDVALVGWEGVTWSAVMPDAPADPLPFSAEARALLLDERQDLADALATAIGIELHRRREALEAVRKN